MRSAFIIIIAAVLVGCKTTPDPIEHFVTTYTADYGVPIRDLPKDASAQQVISATFQRIGYGTKSGNPQREKIYRISEIRQVHIRGSSPGIYTEALVETDRGARIVLFRYEGSKDGWWSQVWFYDANFYQKPSA